MTAQAKGRRGGPGHDNSDRKIRGRVRGDNNPLPSLLPTETSEHLCGLKVQPAKEKSLRWWPKPEQFEQLNKSSGVVQKIK